VNVSAREVQHAGFVDGVKETLAESGIDPGRLVLEITETALLRATPATVATLDELRGLGVRISIDDFGTGYFSLSHLRQFPVDVLKIASEFVQGADAGDRSSALAGAIISAGAVRAMQMDINPDWVNFNSYDVDPDGTAHGTGLFGATGTDRYLRPNSRDFVAVMVRGLVVPGASTQLVPNGPVKGEARAT